MAEIAETSTSGLDVPPHRPPSSSKNRGRSRLLWWVEMVAVAVVIAVLLASNVFNLGAPIFGGDFVRADAMRLSPTAGPVITGAQTGH